MHMIAGIPSGFNGNGSYVQRFAACSRKDTFPERLINPPYILKPRATAERFSVSGTAKSGAGDQHLCARQATEFIQTSVMNWPE